MEKNIYAIIQDWHELFKNGTITENEFNSKKNELLNIEKKKIEEQEKQRVNDNVEFEKSKSFVNKSILYTIGIILIGVLAFYYFNRNKNEQFETENNSGGNIENDTILGNYIVQADNSNLVHFYEEPDITTEKKAYFSTNDTVYVAQIENGFGYVRFLNSKGQKSIGWLPLEKMIYCEECISEDVENESINNSLEKEEKYVNVVNPDNDNQTIDFLKNNINQEYCFRENAEDEKNENGYSMFKLKIIISSINEITGTFGYLSNKDVDSWNGEIKGKLVGNIIEGNYSYETEGNANNEKFKMYIDERHSKIIFSNGETRNLGIVKDCESYKFKN